MLSEDDEKAGISLSGVLATPFVREHLKFLIVVEIGEDKLGMAFRGVGSKHCLFRTGPQDEVGEFRDCCQSKPPPVGSH